MPEPSPWFLRLFKIILKYTSVNVFSKRIVFYFSLDEISEEPIKYLKDAIHSNLIQTWCKQIICRDEFVGSSLSSMDIQHNIKFWNLKYRISKLKRNSFHWMRIKSLKFGIFCCFGCDACVIFPLEFPEKTEWLLYKSGRLNNCYDL